MGPHKFRMHEYIIETNSLRQNMMRSLIDLGQGYHHGAPNIILSTLNLPIR
jgi:hypothetical protein